MALTVENGRHQQTVFVAPLRKLGSYAHLSSKDRSDKQKVITVGLQTHAGTRVGSLHVHIDGTFKFFPSRAGKDGGYGANIAAAAIPGYISCEDESAEGKASSVSNE
ncbi:hypothetical protein FQN50_003169 [Emmonsiellopsis sp. PD_5]|nr:hypothetical protein FQN50_003169 [Emmonsiellopsis sp. PD_5]